MTNLNKKLLIGDPAIFAVESRIKKAYEDLSQMALGYFVLHIRGRSFGVCKPDATLLSCAYGQTLRRLSRRGLHVAPFSLEPRGSDIIDAIGEALYNPSPTRSSFFGLSAEQFSDFVHSSECQWHRNCDEAFDDGSGILHFDIGDSVRLIADKPPRDMQNWNHDSNTLVEVCLKSDDFYSLLGRWLETFHREWQNTSKSDSKVG